MKTLPELDALRVIERLQAALATADRDHAPRPMLVFDADGTLWSGDVGFDLFTKAMQLGALRDDARAALAAEARDIGVDPSGDPNAIASRLVAAHARGEYDDARAFSMMAWAFAGFALNEMAAFAAAVVSEARLAERIFPFVPLLIEWARRADVAITICSASPVSVVVAGARLLGLDAGDVVAVEPEVAHGTLLAKLVTGPAPYGAGKVARLALSRAGFGIVGGFGDSAGDAHFLRLARVPVAVRPHARLLDLAPTIPGLVSLVG